MIRTLLTVAFVSVGASLPGQAQAAGCGWYAFAGAFQNYGNAQRRARNVGGRIFDVDNSDSPNAGQGFYTVGSGPTSRSRANRAKRRFQSNGVDSYIARRCFY